MPRQCPLSSHQYTSRRIFMLTVPDAFRRVTSAIRRSPSWGRIGSACRARRNSDRAESPSEHEVLVSVRSPAFLKEHSRVLPGLGIRETVLAIPGHDLLSGNQEVLAVPEIARTDD